MKTRHHFLCKSWKLDIFCAKHCKPDILWFREQSTNYFII